MDGGLIMGHGREKTSHSSHHGPRGKQGRPRQGSGKHRAVPARAFVRSRSPFSEHHAASRARPPEPPPPESFPRIPCKGEYTDEAAAERIAWLEGQTGQKLARILRPELTPEDVRGNIENFIGTVQIPVGMAGPLWVRGDFAQGWFFAPFATTEGALVASVSRGARACSLAGGVRTHIIWKKMVRAPLFKFRDLDGAAAFTEWLHRHADELRTQVGKVSRRAALLEIEPYLMGNMVHVRFCFQTGDAAGQNMTTLCTWVACKWILEEIEKAPRMKLDRYLIEGNMSGDKKIAYQSYLSGRGVRVTADCFLPREVVEEVFKTTPEAMEDGNNCGMVGAKQAGMLGYNINFANVVAALFAATGQDIACVHESSVGQVYVQAREDGLYASVLLPNLVIGTLGGGTRLPAQRECLQIMDCYGPEKINKFAEILAAFCLSLDLSTMAAIVADHFATAHERLGRPSAFQKVFRKEDLGKEFFEKVLRSYARKGVHKVVSVKAMKEASDSSILSKLTNERNTKLIGLFPFRVTYQDADRRKVSEEVMVKIKPTDRDVLAMARGMVTLSGNERLIQLYELYLEKLEFYRCHVRELAIYSLGDPRLRRYFPKILDIQEDKAGEFYCIVMEYLGGLSHLNSENDPHSWRDEDIQVVLRGMAEIHSLYLGRPAADLAGVPLVAISADTVRSMRALWKEFTDANNYQHPDLVTEERWAAMHRMIDQRPEDWKRIEAFPRTLVHNDFNPRNLCIRGEEGGRRLCLFDWELATYHVPQRDLAEFLAYVLPENTPARVYRKHVGQYRKELERQAGRPFDPQEFQEVFRLAMKDLAVTRMNLYLTAHNFRRYDFLNRVYPNIMNYLAEEQE